MKQKIAEKPSLTRLQIHYLNTNIKGILILILVAYHFISAAVNTSVGVHEIDNSLMTVLFPIIMLFYCAVPLFVFITGYSAKDTGTCRETAFSLYFVPYILLTLLMAIEYAIIGGLPLRFFPFEPCLQLWYLLSMFVWMLLLKDIANIRFILPISVVLAVVSGMVANNDLFVFSSGLTTFFSLSRTVYFLPFLIIGYKATNKTMSGLRNAPLEIGIVAIVLFIAISMGFFAAISSTENFNVYSLLLMKGDASYISYLSHMDAYWKANLFGAVTTVFLMITCVLLIFIVVRFMPTKKIRFITRMGETSLTIYCLHGFIVVPIMGFVTKCSVPVAIAIAFVGSVLLCSLLSINAVHKRYVKLIFKIGDIIKVKKSDNK